MNHVIGRGAAMPSAGVPEVAVDPFSDAFLADPYAFHGALRDAGPLFWMSSHGIYGMARHAEVAAALKDWETFCSGRGVGLSDFAKEPPYRPPSLLLETDPPTHDQTRKLMNGIVSMHAINRIRPIWLERAERLADALVAKRTFDAIGDLANVYPLQVFPDTIGLRSEGREHLLPYAAAVFNAFGPRNALFERTEIAAGKAAAWVNDACKRANLSDDGWGADVYRMADAGKCTEAEAERLVRSFLTAGIDTTVNGIGNMIYAFSSFPDEWITLRANPALRKRAFDESLRWDSTVQTFFRTTTRDVAVAGATIPKDSKILLFLAAANRDPRRWDRPDTFDVARIASGHVGFGYGVHQCLGQMVARLEADLMLEALLARVKSIRATGPATRRLNNTLHALASLPVEIEPA